MSRQLLIETRMNSLSLCEGVKTKHPGCLGTLSGPCADFKNPTRNNNFYSRKLWENVFKDPLVKESLEDRVLIGELDHPGDRLETKATNAAIVMTGYDFDDQNGTVNGTFDILDTPNGRILRSLLDYGCKIGVSSRGEGDVTTEESNGKTVENVDEDTYYFVGFDAVVLPAVKKAKPALQESLKRENLKESLKTQIQDSTTKGELDLIKKVVEATELPEVGSLLESIENKSKELEGINNSSNLLEDLEKSSSKISQLEDENKKLKQEVINCKSRVKRFVESRVKMNQEIGCQSDKYNSLEENYKSVVFELGATNNKVKNLTSNLQESVRRCKELEESLTTAEDTSSQYKSQVESLSEALDASQKRLVSQIKKSKELSEQVKSVKKEMSKQLQESKIKESKALKSCSQMKKSLEESQRNSGSLIKDYVEKKSVELGFNSKKILESVTSKTSIDEINKLIEEEVDREDRYRRVPTTNDKLLEALSSSQIRVSSGVETVDEESSQFKSFMGQTYKMK